MRPIFAPNPIWLVLILGAPPAPTREVYAAVLPADSRRSSAPLLEVLAAGDAPPDDLVFNRLEAAAYRRFPELAGLARQIAEVAERPVHLSGSGSAFFVLCGSVKEAAHTAERIRSKTHLSADIVRTLTSEEVI